MTTVRRPKVRSNKPPPCLTAEELRDEALRTLYSYHPLAFQLDNFVAAAQVFATLAVAQAIREAGRR